MAYEDIEDSSGWNGYILLILSIGMPYYQRGCNTNHRQVSIAQTNRTQVLTWERHISTTPALVDFGACSWLDWIAIETSFPESPRSLKTEFGVKSYGFSVRWPVLFLGGRQCRPCTVITASFQILTASVSRMSIYTHPMAPGRAANAPDLQNLFKALYELSPTLSLWE